MKAITAINAIIILVLGVLTVMAVLTLFLSSYNPATQGTSLESATRATCQKINPAFCHYPGYAARVPVEDFDANNNGVLNDHEREADGRTKYGEDNFEMLCYHYYGGPASWGPGDIYKEDFIDICMVKVCGCPKYTYPDDYY